MDKKTCKEELQLVVHDFSLSLEEPLHLLYSKGKLKSANEILEKLLKCLPGRYDGKSNVLEFIVQVEECAQAHEIDLDDILGTMPLVLADRALEWWVQLPPIATWNSFSDALLRSFPPEGRALKWQNRQHNCQCLDKHRIKAKRNWKRRCFAAGQQSHIYPLLCHTTRSGGCYCSGHCLTANTTSDEELALEQVSTSTDRVPAEPDSQAEELTRLTIPTINRRNGRLRSASGNARN